MPRTLLGAGHFCFHYGHRADYGIVDTMVYDATAKKLAVKLIGTVESNLDYGAVNYGDPITVGIAQWYGVRAAALLNRMRTANPAWWYGVQGSINSQLISIPDTDVFWNTRRLTLAEGNSLIGAMTRNQALQNLQLTDDLDAYVTVATAQGIDPDTETDVMLYFFSLYHQGGTLAYGVIDWTSNPTLEEVHAATLAHSVYGQYGSRYNTTYDLISVADLSGVDPIPDPPAPDPVPVNGNAQLITLVGDNLHVKFKDAEKVVFVPTGRGQWLARKAADPPPVTPPSQPPPPADVGTWVLPLTGSPVMTSPYGPRPAPPGTMAAAFHFGVDFANAGAAGNVVSPCPLVITVAFEQGTPGDPSSGTAGSYVKGHTVDGAYTFNFYHMQAGSIAVSVGDTTTTGQVLGIEGATGNVTGRHVHFEAYVGNFVSPWPPPYGTPTDPLPILRAHGVSV
jgi:murein DD-endopeptidase MepM/ murein hydrolase activator NlpD